MESFGVDTGDPDHEALQEAINFSCRLFEEQDRRDAQRDAEAEARREWYASIDSEQVIERIYDVYSQLGERLNRFAEGFSEEQVVIWLQRIDEASGAKKPLDEDIFAAFFLRDGPEDYLANYQHEAECALDRLLALGAETNDLSQAVALITTLKDPLLACYFLSKVKVYDDGSQYRGALTSVSQKQHLQRARREIFSDKTGIMKALIVGLKILRPDRNVKKITERSIYQPLQEIATYPQVPYQVLRQALHGQQMEQPT